MLQNTIETLNYVLFLLPGETSTESTLYVGVLRLGNFAFAMETQHTDAVSIAKTSKVKNGTHLFILPRIKKTLGCVDEKFACCTSQTLTKDLETFC